MIDKWSSVPTLLRFTHIISLIIEVLFVVEICFSINAWGPCELNWCIDYQVTLPEIEGLLDQKGSTARIFFLGSQN